MSLHSGVIRTIKRIIGLFFSHVYEDNYRLVKMPSQLAQAKRAKLEAKHSLALKSDQGLVHNTVWLVKIFGWLA